MTAPAPQGPELFGWDCEQIGNWALHALTLYADNDRPTLRVMLATARRLESEGHTLESRARAFENYWLARCAVQFQNRMPNMRLADDNAALQLVHMLRDLLGFVDWETVAEHYAAKLEAAR